MRKSNYLSRKFSTMGANMFTEMTSTTLENIQKLFGKKFIDVALGIIVMSVLTSVCFYLGYFRSLGIYMSDLDINIFELFDIEIVVIIAIVYAVIYERGLKHQNGGHDNALTLNYRITSIAIVSVLFLLMIFAIYKGPFESDMVLSYLMNNLGLFFLPCLLTGFLMWCILSFNKRSVIEFALIFCSISIVSYTAGMYRAEELILSGTRNDHIIQLENGQKMECFLIKRFDSGDLVFFNNEPTFISAKNDRIVRFTKLSAITEISTGNKTAE